LGARKVIAVEPDNVIEIARQVAAANHCADKIQFIHGSSFGLTLSEPADIIISDLRGILPWFEKHLPAILDARKRLLSQRGRLIPSRDLVWAALVESPELYSPYLKPWGSKPLGVDLAAAQRFVVNRWGRGSSVLPSQFLGQPQLWATLDYATIEDLNVSATICWTVGTSGTAHGLLLWFDAEMCDGIGFSNHPAEPPLIYHNGFFPFSAPMELISGDLVTIDLRATLVGEDYVWAWKTMVSSSDSAQPRIEFNQSTFFGCPLSREQIATRSEKHTAQLGEEGLIDRAVLDLMDGKRTLALIAEELREKFPSNFPTTGEALARVGELSVRYSRRPAPFV
jgi:protein arginine N-methyltransferase 1